MTYLLTKLDMAAIRKADSLAVHLRDGEPCVRLIKRADREVAFAQDIEHVIPAPVSLRSLTYGTKMTGRCFAHSDFYRGQDTHISAVFDTLRVGDDIAFEFCPDYHTNGNLKAHGIHGDVLVLVVKRGKRRSRFEIDHVASPDNTARMCQGA